MQKKINESQSKGKEIPMIVTDETIRDFNLDPKKIGTWKYGNRWFKVIMVPGTEEQYNVYVQSEQNEIKRMERDSRCMIRGKNEKLIRCPDTNKCEDCPRFAKVKMKDNMTASLSDLIGKKDEPAYQKNEETAVINKMELEYLIKELNKINPQYGNIFILLYEENTQKEIAEVLHMPERTVSDKVKIVKREVAKLKKAWNVEE